MSLPITEQEYLQAQKNLNALTLAINDDIIVDPPTGVSYKSVPMVIREIQEEASQMLGQLDSDIGSKMLEIASLKEASAAAAERAESAANSGGLTTPVPISSANSAILTGTYYTTGDVPTAEQYKVDVIATDSQIIQTATAGDGSIFTRTFPIGTTSDYPTWKSQANDQSIKIAFTSNFKSIAAMIDYENPVHGQSAIVESYYEGKAFGGGTFVYDSNQSTVNNGITVFNGWVRSAQSVYYFEDAGIELSEITTNKVIVEFVNYNAQSKPVFSVEYVKSQDSDLYANNCAKLARLNLLPVNSNVMPAVSGVVYLGVLNLTTALNIDMNNASFEIPKYSVKIGPVADAMSESEKTAANAAGTVFINKAKMVPQIQFIAPSEVFESNKTSMEDTDTEITIPGNHSFKKGALIVLWDQLYKSGGQEVHEVANLIESTSYDSVADLTTIVMKHPILSKFDSVQDAVVTVNNKIIVRVYPNPINNPTVKNFKFNNESGSLGRHVMFEGAINPIAHNCSSKRSYGHFVSMYRCYNPVAYSISCVDPMGVGGGIGYGVTYMACRNGLMRDLYGFGMRHIMDMDGCYGAFYIENIHCDDSASTVVTLSHNGYAGGDFFVNNVSGSTQSYDTYAIGLSRQAFEFNVYKKTDIAPANNPMANTNRIGLHRNLNITIKNVDVKFNSKTKVNALHYAIYCQISGKNLFIDNMKFMHSNLEDLKFPTEIASSAVRVLGLWENVTVQNVRQDRGYAAVQVSTNQYSANQIDLGNVVLNNIYCGECYSSPIYIIGYNLVANNILYDSVEKALNPVVNHLSPATDPVAESVIIRGVSRNKAASVGVATYSKTANSFKNGFIELETSGVYSFTYATASSDIKDTAGIFNFWKASIIEVSCPTDLTVTSVFFIPTPLFVGQQVKLKNVGAFPITFAAGGYNHAAFTITPGKFVDLKCGIVADPKKWVVVSN